MSVNTTALNSSQETRLQETENRSLGAASPKHWLSLDAWSVIIAFAAALIIRLGIFKHVPW